MRTWRSLVVGILLSCAAKIAFGFVPLVAAGVPLLAPVVTTSTGVALATWAAIAGGVGAILYSVGLRDQSGNEYLHVRVHPSAPTDTYTGWTAGVGGADPAPPSTAGAPQTYRQYPFSDAQCVNTHFPTVGAVAACHCSVLMATFVNGDCSTRDANESTGVYNLTICNGAGQAAGWCPAHDGPSGPYTANLVTTCPPGYTNSSGLCTLNSPTSVRFPSNGRCGLKISSGVMSYDSRDPDCDSPPAGLLSADGKTMTVNNGVTQQRVRINADGTVEVTEWAPGTSPGTTQIQDVKAASPTAATNPSQMQSERRSTVNATGSDAMALEPAAATQNATPFPDDYSREVTQQANLSKLTEIDTKLDKLQDIKDKLTGDPSNTPTDPVSRGQGDIEGVFFPGAFDALKGWSMPARAVACPTWSFSIWGQSYTINSHCGLIEQQRAVVSAICLLVYALIALFVVLGA
jgi:hypothetical protein